MHRQPDGAYTGQAGCERIGRHGVRQGNAELVAGAAGADLAVRAGIDVRVDPQRHTRRAAGLQRHGGQGGQFLDALHVDDRPARYAGLQRAQQLAAADHIGADPCRRHRCENGEVVVRLHRVVYRDAGHRLPQQAQPAAQRLGAGDPAGRAVPGRDAGQGNAVEQQAVQRVRAQARACGDQVGGGRLVRDDVCIHRPII